MRRRLRVVSTLEVQEGESVVRARQLGVELERSPIRSDRLVQSPRTREGDRHVLENARIIGMIAQRQTIRREGRIEIALTFQGERLVQIVEALRLHATVRLAAEETAQPGHAMRNGREKPKGGGRRRQE